MGRLSVDLPVIDFRSSPSFFDEANDTDRAGWHPMQELQFRSGVDPGDFRAYIL